MANDYNNTDWTEDANTKASASSNIEGATQLNNTLAIGVNDTGYDVKFFGDTATNGYMLWDASTDDLILGSSSKIGIGEPSPDALLHIRETTDDTAAYLRIETANNGNGDIGVLFQEITTIKAAVGYDAGRDAVALVHASGLDSSNGINILSSGNVGIGTKTPDALLHLESSTDTALIIRADSDNSDENDNPLIHLQQDYRAAGASGVLADTKIGMIGDAGQIYTSSIANASYITAQGSISTGDSDTGTIQFATGGNNGQDTDVTARLATARMTITASGNVGIGEASPDKVLHVKETSDSAYCAMLENTDADNPYGLFIHYTGGAPNADNTDFFIACNDSSTSRFRVSGNGDVDTSTGTGISSISDERMKENIADFTGGLSIVDTLKPRTFTWKSGADRGMTGTRYGFIAQEILATSGVEANMSLAKSNSFDEHHPDYGVINQFCTDGILKSSQMSAKECVLISAIQELSAKVTALENA